VKADGCLEYIRIFPPRLEAEFTSLAFSTALPNNYEEKLWRLCQNQKSGILPLVICPRGSNSWKWPPHWKATNEHAWTSRFLLPNDIFVYVRTVVYTVMNIRLP